MDIMGFDIDVTVGTPECGEASHGDFSLSEQAMTINKKDTAEIQNSTMIHECVEACNQILFDSSLEHRDICLLEAFWYQVITSNPKIFCNVANKKSIVALFDK